jgi:hypothetical protein
MEDNSLCTISLPAGIVWFRSAEQNEGLVSHFRLRSETPRIRLVLLTGVE